jgi:hypothetical protein
MRIKLDKKKPQYTFIFWKGEGREEKNPSKPNICVIMHMRLTTGKTMSRCFHCCYEMRCLASIRHVTRCPLAIARANHFYF